MEFKNEISASLTMHGHSFEECRTLRIDGSQATLLGKFGLNRSFIEIHDHRSMQVERRLMHSVQDSTVRSWLGLSR